MTERGRRRPRQVVVDLASVRRRLRAAGEADLAPWASVRGILRDAVGESRFEIWLAPLELIAVDLEGTLIVSAPPETVGWLLARFGSVLDRAAERAGRSLRVANEVERRAAESLTPAAASAASGGAPADGTTGGSPGSEAAVPDRALGTGVGSRRYSQRGRWHGQPTRAPTHTSSHPASEPDGHTQTKEVS